MAITRDSIIEAALTILDSYGLPDLSMRRIGSVAGVQAATIYWHFANKQTLLAALADTIVEKIPSCENLEQWASASREVMHRYRDSAEIIAATLAVGLGNSPFDAQAYELVRRSGMSDEDARRVVHTLTHFVLGHTMHEQTRQTLMAMKIIDSAQQVRDDEGFADGIAMILAGSKALRPER